MPQISPRSYTAADYWSLPDGQRAELINGQLYNMAPPNRIHQELSFSIARKFADYIDHKGGSCRVYPAPFAVNLNADDEVYVEPDISIVCDRNKLTDRGCIGAPDLIVEIVSPGSRRMDYNIKNGKYAEASVREYWIVDPEKQQTTVYYYEKDAAPTILPFNQSITASIYEDFSINIDELLQALPFIVP